MSKERSCAGRFFKSPVTWGETLGTLSAAGGAALLRQFTNILNSIEVGNHAETLAVVAAGGAAAYATGRVVSAVATWAFGLCCSSPKPSARLNINTHQAYGALADAPNNTNTAPTRV